MDSPGQPVLQWLIEGYDSGRPLILLFDFDGTLVPIVDHPRSIRFPPTTRATLAELATQENIFVGIVSSRPLTDVKAIIDLPDLYYSGSSGLELDLLGVQPIPPQVEQGLELLGELASCVEEFLPRYEGAWIERKPLGLSIHYRALDAEAIPSFQETIRHILCAFSDQLQVWAVSRAYEIIPALGISKATAVQRIIEDAARDALPFYAGDQANDADALALVSDMGGLSVGVGSAAPDVADVFLESPRNLAQILHRFVSDITADQSSSFPRSNSF